MNFLPDARMRCDKCKNPASITYTLSGSKEDLRREFPDGYRVSMNFNEERVQQLDDSLGEA